MLIFANLYFWNADICLQYFGLKRKRVHLKIGAQKDKMEHYDQSKLQSMLF